MSKFILKNKSIFDRFTRYKFFKLGNDIPLVVVKRFSRISSVTNLGNLLCSRPVQLSIWLSKESIEKKDKINSELFLKEKKRNTTYD